jgi:hypothetical protein
MLHNLLGIRLKSVKLVYRLEHLYSMYALKGSSIFGMDPPTPSLGSTPHHVLHMVHLAYLDEVQ